MKIALCLLVLLPLVYSAELTDEQKRAFFGHFTTDSLSMHISFYEDTHAYFYWK